MNLTIPPFPNDDDTDYLEDSTDFRKFSDCLKPDKGFPH